MSLTTEPAALLFPSQAVIAAYLTGHPRMTPLALNASPFIAAIAKVFANSTKPLQDVERDVRSTTCALNTQDELSAVELITLDVALTRALIACARPPVAKF
jgi:hypothetical protein